METKNSLLDSSADRDTSDSSIGFFAVVAPCQIRTCIDRSQAGPTDPTSHRPSTPPPPLRDKQTTHHMYRHHDRPSPPPSASGTGFSLIESEWPTLSAPAQTALQGLLTHHSVVRHPRRRRPRCRPTKRRRRVVLPTNAEPHVMELARKGELSLLATVLQVVGTAHPAVVSTKQLIKAGAALTVVVPQLTPGCLDAKDMVQAAAVFLSMKGFLQGSEKPLEKGGFSKAWSWQVDEIMDELNELEDEFYKDDPRHYEWLTRERFIPTEAHVDPTSLEQVLLKGTGTKTAVKKKSQTPSNRKKAKPAAEKVDEVTVEVLRETTGSDAS